MVKLDHAHLFCSDIAAATRYYQTMFGARVVYDTKLAGSRSLRLDLNGAALHLYDQPPRGGGRPLVHHLGLRTDDLDELVGHMRGHGAVFRKGITEVFTNSGSRHDISAIVRRYPRLKAQASLRRADRVIE